MQRYQNESFDDLKTLNPSKTSIEVYFVSKATIWSFARYIDKGVK